MITDTIKVYRCPLTDCPTPERTYAHEAQFVLHLMGRKGHAMKKRAARKLLRDAKSTTALALPSTRALVAERPITTEQRIKRNLTEIARLREEVERDIDDERRQLDRRGRDLVRARRFLEAL